MLYSVARNSFQPLYLPSYSFGHHPHFIITGERWNIDEVVNWTLTITALYQAPTCYYLWIRCQDILTSLLGSISPLSSVSQFSSREPWPQETIPVDSPMHALGHIQMKLTEPLHLQRKKCYSEVPNTNLPQLFYTLWSCYWISPTGFHTMGNPDGVQHLLKCA